jgi:hypothetical protein
MTLSAKWTVSFLAVSAVAAGTFAFAGCTVTSGTPDNTEGGSGNPTPDAGAADATPAAVCQGNKQTSGDFVNATCQAKLNAVCCTELKTCFDIVLTPDDAGAGTDDCNKYATCIDSCKKNPDGGVPETDTTKIAACEKDCDALTQNTVIQAYDAIVACASLKANAECQ